MAKAKNLCLVQRSPRVAGNGGGSGPPAQYHVVVVERNIGLGSAHQRKNVKGVTKKSFLVVNPFVRTGLSGLLGLSAAFRVVPVHEQGQEIVLVATVKETYLKWLHVNSIVVKQQDQVLLNKFQY